MNNLYDLRIDEEGIIKQINLSGSIKRRLFDIGLIPGTKVKCLFTSPFNDPKAYSIRNTVIAIREEEAKEILIDKLGDECV